jgi:hypothetical protein
VDKSTGVIGFNKYGNIYFNLLFYSKLHLKSSDKVDAYCYWFVVFCHELAHNFVDEHNADHSFISEHFMSSHLRKLMSSIPNFTQSEITVQNPTKVVTKRKIEDQIQEALQDLSASEEEEEIESTYSLRSGGKKKAVKVKQTKGRKKAKKEKDNLPPRQDVEIIEID